MIEHKLFIGGVEVDLALPIPEIEAKINDMAGKCYPGGLVQATYKEIDERTAEITFKRHLPFDYVHGLGGNCMNYIDCAIVSGLTEDCFTLDLSGKKTPVCGPLIPWDRIWFVPTMAFGAFFRQFNETMVQEKLSRINITAGMDELTVVVKYPRDKGKYDDDIADLGTELGPLSGHRGETIDIRLKELGEICQRSQVKKKSYMGLVSYLLKTYEITLNIL